MSVGENYRNNGNEQVCNASIKAETNAIWIVLAQYRHGPSFARSNLFLNRECGDASKGEAE